LPVKDLNDFFLKGHKQEELKTLFAGARQFPGARTIVSVNEFLDMEESPQPFLLDRMIVENSVNALTADSGGGKSLLALKMVESMAKGEKFLGEFETKKTKTLILDLEMNHNDLIQRTHSIIQDKMEGLDFYHCQTFNIEDHNDFRWLTSNIERSGYKLIVFDTLSGAHERPENDNTEMNLVNKKFIELCNRYGSTVLFFHHNKKPQRGDAPNQSGSRGAGAIIDKAASHLFLDSKECIIAIGEEQKIGIPGLRMIVEQKKKRQRKKCERYAVNCWYNPGTKKTTFEYAGLDEKADTAVEKSESSIINLVKKGELYTMKEIQEVIGESSNTKTAVKNLVAKKILGERDIEEGEEIIRSGKKVNGKAKLYFLAE
jgi:hypothetical protein